MQPMRQLSRRLQAARQLSRRLQSASQLSRQLQAAHQPSLQGPRKQAAVQTALQLSRRPHLVSIGCAHLSLMGQLLPEVLQRAG